MSGLLAAAANYGRDEAMAIIRWHGDILSDGETSEYAEIAARQTVRHCREFLSDAPCEWPQFVATLTDAGFGRWLAVANETE